MEQLFEPHCRIANTEAGKLQWNFERSIGMMDAYGAMYRSMNKGYEFSRTYIAVQCVLKYQDWIDDNSEEEG